MCIRDRTNTCFVLGAEVVCKWMRRLDDGPSVEVEMLRELAPRATELLVPELLGCLDLHAGDGIVRTVASFTRFIPNQGSAWQLTLDEVRRSFERAMVRGTAAPTGKSSGALTDGEVLGAFATIAEQLGRRTADLHVALAASPHPDFVPKPLNARPEYQGRHTLAARSLDMLERALPSLSLIHISEPTRPY